MADRALRTYWDSCVFIHALKKTEGHYKKIRALEDEAKSGTADIFISALVIAEVVKTKKHGKMSDTDLRLIKGYFENKWIKVVPVDRPVAKSAADIVRNHDLKPPDAIHLATAIRCGCDVFYTYDGDGDDPGLLQEHGKIGIPSLTIKKPGDFGQMTTDMI